ncbi:MAG: HAD family hydrolase [Fimbriimonadaceae bacterium]|nr:HAD family hydrolase [Fimbriimonadaceae bacterium]
MSLLRTELVGVKAIYFDLDDTLCGYWEASKRALAETFALHGPHGHTAEEMVRAWASAFRTFSPTIKRSEWYSTYLKSGGETRLEQMRRALAAVGLEDEPRAQLLSDSYGELRDRYLSLFPESIEVLDRLSAQFPLGLMTNGPADIQRQEIATLGIEKYFRHILIEGEMGEGKPVAAVFRRAESLMGCEGSELLFVGNSYHHDILPSIESGWRTVWVRRPTDIPPSADGQSQPEARPNDAPPPTLEINNLLELFAG